MKDSESIHSIFEYKKHLLQNSFNDKPTTI